MRLPRGEVTQKLLAVVRLAVAPEPGPGADVAEVVLQTTTGDLHEVGLVSAISNIRSFLSSRSWFFPPLTDDVHADHIPSKTMQSASASLWPGSSSIERSLGCQRASNEPQAED